MQRDDILPYAGAADDELPPLSMGMFFRRLVQWTAILWVCAVPSAAWTIVGFNRWGMVAGVFFFVAAYTACSCTRVFREFYMRPFVRQTFYVGFGARIAISALFPVGMAVDLLPGMFSASVSRQIWGNEQDFVGTLLTTLVQGTLLHVLVTLFMLVVYSMYRVHFRTRNAVGY